VITHSLKDAQFEEKDVTVDILRLDLIHPVVSGNKWFKLKYYLQLALAENKNAILSFGGPFSNHLVAVAYACRQNGLASVGIVLTEKPVELSATLLDAQDYGMELEFAGRIPFNEMEKLIDLCSKKYPGHMVVPMGGEGELGVKGAEEILQTCDAGKYSHIACSAGTGTMLAGIVRASLPNQQVLGISSLKINDPAQNSIQQTIAKYSAKSNYRLFFEYHFGGYARINTALTSFMNEAWSKYQVPTDIVYTGKLLFALTDLVHNNYFPQGSSLLVIHSGGLQGNRSLPKGILSFQ
jgi:1-aminocyclopropane-1-carboxylate deaminase